VTATGADHGVMRELNRSLVLEILRARSPVSRAAIAKESQLAKPTVSAIVDGLLSEGLAREVGRGTTTAEGGRPPILLEFNARSQFFAGVHIGVHRTTVVVTDAVGLELARRDAPTPVDDAHAAFDAVGDLATAALSAAGGSKRRLGAVGVCVPGLVDLDDGICRLAPNLGWRDVRVRDLVAVAIGSRAPVYVHNTAQACAVAEALEGAAQGASDVVLLYAGTGVGAGLIVDKHLFRGMSGIAGEIGHVSVVGETTKCSCGKHGCLETVASASAIERRAGRPLAALAELAGKNDRAARGALEHAGRELGRAASWLVNVFNPQVLVIGGGVAEVGDLFLGPLRAVVAELSLPEATEHLAIRPWSLGQDAKVRGAVLVAMQRAERSVRVIFGGGQ
jgi:predicted NBD/HSP70 family sugar kinase